MSVGGDGPGSGVETNGPNYLRTRCERSFAHDSYRSLGSRGFRGVRYNYVYAGLRGPCGRCKASRRYIVRNHGQGRLSGLLHLR